MFDPDDLDNLTDEELRALEREFSRWREWQAGLLVEREAAGHVWSPVQRRVPGWHGAAGARFPSYGWFSDHEWAVTVKPNPRYL